MGRKRLLLLLDNAEHLLPDLAPELAELRGAVPSLAMLVTSRERLQLTGEEVWPVPTLADQEGEELFLTRARSLGAEPANGQAVSELCARLDNLPLALELAAARAVVFTPDQFLERLGQRLDLLRGSRDADPRQQTLRTTIDWSYQLLEETDRRVFRALSIFTGGCTYEAAEHVAGADPDTLQSLLDKSLIRRRDSPHGSRYRMLETIREFAIEALIADQDADAVRGRHAVFFATCAERVHAEIGTGTEEKAAGLDKLASDLPNFRVALRSLRDGNDIEQELRLLTALFWLWLSRGYSGEAAEHFARALEVVTTAGRSFGCGRTRPRGMLPWSVERSTWRARAPRRGSMRRKRQEMIGHP